MKTAVIILATALLAGGATLDSPADEARIPAFAVRLLDDDRLLTHTELRGVYTLISFWSTDCAACVRELPFLEDAHARFGDRIEMLSISRDRDPATVQAFRRDRSAMPWSHAVVGPDSDVFAAFGVRGTPHTILVDPEGRIVAETRHLLGERLVRNLRAFVAGCGG